MVSMQGYVTVFKHCLPACDLPGVIAARYICLGLATEEPFHLSVPSAFVLNVGVFGHQATAAASCPVTDQWRLSYLEVLCLHASFTLAQALHILKTFAYPGKGCL